MIGKEGKEGKVVGWGEGGDKVEEDDEEGVEDNDEEESC